MPTRSPWLVALALLVLWIAACATPPASEPPTNATPYVPQPVYCADGSPAPCGVMPSMIGPDPGLPEPGVGYEGLSNDVTSFKDDIQTPFDNMSWQMFVALNQVADGEYAWQSYTRVEEVFGGAPAVPCDNPGNLPVFNLASKGGGQPSDRAEEILQAATGKPLIDRNGNWTLYERRLNDVELAYLKNDDWDLTTVAGQKKFIEDGHTVDFTESASIANGDLGAIELKIAWRILDTAQGDDPSRFITLEALLAVDASEVRDSDSPICQQVQLGLVGFHIIQKNPQFKSLKPEWIWASFEHADNVPLSANACDPVDSDCYVRPTNPVVCNAPASATATYSYYQNDCTDNGGACPQNEPPALKAQEKNYYWSAQQPYAGDYLYDGKYGTQIARCWQIYKLTQELNQQWTATLGNEGSVLANYILIGTQWGANVEPTPGTIANGGVPAFLSNATMESYIQTKSYGTCLGCHTGATLAYEGPDKKQYDANFSFLLGLAE